MHDKRLGQTFEDNVSGFVGTVTTVAEYYGRKEKMLELTAKTGPTGDDKSRWIPETRCEPHSNQTKAGFQ